MKYFKKLLDILQKIRYNTIKDKVIETIKHVFYSLEDLQMKIEIGAMVNGVFIKKGNIVKMAKKGFVPFYATVINMDDKRIDFLPEDDDNECYFYWNELDFIELV